MTSVKTKTGTLYTRFLRVTDIKDKDTKAVIGDQMTLFVYLELNFLKGKIGEGQNGEAKWVKLMAGESYVTSDDPKATAAFTRKAVMSDDPRTPGRESKEWRFLVSDDDKLAIKTEVLRLIKEIKGLDWSIEGDMKRTFSIMKGKTGDSHLVEVEQAPIESTRVSFKTTTKTVESVGKKALGL